MPMTIMQCLATFRPSDRRLLARELRMENSRAFAIYAIEEFVVRWEQADWLDAGSVSRIGRWLAIYQPPEVVGPIADWASSGTSAARTAFVEGIKDGLVERRRHA
jgi:hypothetical protein